MVQPDGLYTELDGKKAKQALRIYKEWIQNILYRGFSSNEYYDDAKKLVDSETKLIDEVIKSRKKLRVYVA
jgi:hypothetical protein